MPIDIMVVRGAGDLDGGVIQEPLLSTLTAALQRGIKELNDSTDTETVDVTTYHNQGIFIGDIVSVDDVSYGTAWVGRVVEVNHGTSGAEPVTMVSLRRKSF